MNISSNGLFMFDFLQDESFVEISPPSVCAMCEQDDSLLKSKVQGRKLILNEPLKS